jgi:predicted enzyme related to lactoylglutathione lyase
MPVESVYTTIYYVDDWDASVAFYRDVLGLKPLYVERGWAEFQAGKQGRIALHARTHEHGSTTTHVSLQVNDIDATLKDMTAKGAHVVEPVRREDFGAVAAIRDPSGNVIGLYEAARRG